MHRGLRVVGSRAPTTRALLTLAAPPQATTLLLAIIAGRPIAVEHVDALVQSRAWRRRKAEARRCWAIKAGLVGVAARRRRRRLAVASGPQVTQDKFLISSSASELKAKLFELMEPKDCAAAQAAEQRQPTGQAGGTADMGGEGHRM